MKIGFCMLSWASPVDEPDHRLISRVADLGYDGIEIPVVHGEPRDYALLERVLKQKGLAPTALTVMPHGMNPISTDPTEREAAKRRIAWCLDCVSELGADLLVGPVHQTLGEFTGLPPSVDEFARLRDFHRFAGEFAASKGITIAVEAMNRFECHMLNTLDGLGSYLDTVAHPAITGMYDTFHAGIEEGDLVGALTRNFRHVRHFHVSESHRGIPGDGHVRWDEVFGALRRGGYNGWLTVESFGRVIPELAAATRVWRDFAENPEDVFPRGIEHIRRVWNAAA